MNYIFMAFEIFPLILMITALIYAVIFKVSKRKIRQQGIGRIVAEFTLTGFFVMFVYVTQFMNFGNGMGQREMNLIPMYPFYIAGKYGSVNAEMTHQILLNVVMCVPLGILLPIVWPAKFRKYRYIFAVSFGLTFFTEMVQLIIGRSGDIDDIIANTFGGLLGYAIFIFVYGLYHLIRKRRINISNYKIQLIISIIVALVIYAPFKVTDIIDSRSEFGHVYYGHLKPAEIHLNNTISDEEITAPVYKINLSGDKDEISSRVIIDSGFSTSRTEYFEDGAEGYFGDDTNAVFIYPNNTWSVSYNYGVDNEDSEPVILEEDFAFKCAEEYIKQFEIDINTLKYLGISEEYGDNNLHLIFEPLETTDDVKAVGEVIISLGEEGKLLGIDYNIIRGDYCKDTELISPLKSIDIAQQIGVGDINKTAYVDDVVLSYYVQQDTGFIIPVWKIEGNLESGLRWNPKIEAFK